MPMRQQWIVIAAVVFATIGVAVSALASMRAAEPRQQPRLFTEIPVTTTSTADSFVAPREHVSPDLGTAPDSDGSPVRNDSNSLPTPDNHGQVVSAFATHIGFRDGVDGPPGALVRTIARSNEQSDRPPRSEPADEHRNNGNNGNSRSDPPGSLHRQNGRNDHSTSDR